MAQGAAAVMSLAGAASVPVIAGMVDASAAVGWTTLSVLAAGLVASCFTVWAHSSPADQRRPSVVIAATVGWVAGAAYAVGAVGAGSQFDHAAVPGMLAGIFGAGAVAAWLIVMPSIRRPLVMVPDVAMMSGTLLGLAAVGMVTVQAGLSPPAAWTVVIVVSAMVTLAGLLIEASSLPADVVWAVDASAAVGVFVAMAGLVSVGSADQISVGLLVVTMGFGVEALRKTRRAAAWGAALGALVLVWQRLAMAGVTTAEAYTLPAAAFLAVIAVWRDRHSRDESSWTTWGPALVVALGPSVLLAIRDPGVLRPVSTVIAAAVVTLLGARWQRRAPVMIGAVSLVALGVQQLAPIVRQLPRWITFAVVGTLLLLVGASYERRRCAARRPAHALPAVALTKRPSPLFDRADPPQAQDVASTVLAIKPAQRPALRRPDQHFHDAEDRSTESHSLRQVPLLVANVVEMLDGGGGFKSVGLGGTTRHDRSGNHGRTNGLGGPSGGPAQQAASSCAFERRTQRSPQVRQSRSGRQLVPSPTPRGSGLTQNALEFRHPGRRSSQ